MSIVNDLTVPAIALALFAGCSKPMPPEISLHDAALRGDVQAIRQHIRAGSDLDEREPGQGTSPLIVAAAFDQVEAAKALIQGGADLNLKNNDGATALMTAAFFGRTEIVKALLAAGADKNARNNAGATALQAVEVPFEQVKSIYDMLRTQLGPAGLTLDYDQIQAERPRIAALLRSDQP